MAVRKSNEAQQRSAEVTPEQKLKLIKRNDAEVRLKCKPQDVREALVAEKKLEAWVRFKGTAEYDNAYNKGLQYWLEKYAKEIIWPQAQALVHDEYGYEGRGIGYSSECAPHLDSGEARLLFMQEAVKAARATGEITVPLSLEIKKAIAKKAEIYGK